PRPLRAASPPSPRSARRRSRKDKRAMRGPGSCANHNARTGRSISGQRPARLERVDRAQPQGAGVGAVVDAQEPEVQAGRELLVDLVVTADQQRDGVVIAEALELAAEPGGEVRADLVVDDVPGPDREIDALLVALVAIGEAELEPRIERDRDLVID